MTTIRDTYVLDAKTPDFAGLGKEVSDYLKGLKGLATSTSKALEDINNELGKKDGARVSQAKVEKLADSLAKLRTAYEQIINAQGNLAKGSVSIDLSAVAREVGSIANQARRMNEELSKSGKSLTSLGNVGRSANTATGTGVRLGTASNAGGAEQQALNQIREQQLASITTTPKALANASKLVSNSFKSMDLGKFNLELSDLDATYKKLVQRTAEFKLSQDEVARSARVLLSALDKQRQEEGAALASKREQVAIDTKLKEIIDARNAAIRQGQRDLLNEVRDLTALGKASTDAATALGGLTKFSQLGGKEAAEALKQLSEAFAKTNLSASQQQAIASRVVDSYTKQTEAAKVLTSALNEEAVSRAKLRERASNLSYNETFSGGDPKKASNARAAVEQRIDSGELRTIQQVSAAYTAELKAQGVQIRANNAQNQVTLQLILEQRQVEAKLTEQMTHFAKQTGIAKVLHGDLRSVISQTVAEAQRLGLTYDKNRVQLEKLLTTNAQLKASQASTSPSSLNDFGVAFGAGFAAQGIVQGLTSVINRFTEFEDQMIKVRRTANASRETMKNLGDEILNVGQQVPIATKELASAAAALGQTGAINFNPNVDFGRNTKEIQDAAQAIKLVGQVSLVSELDINAAATSYGQFATVFSKDIDRITKQLKASGVEAIGASDALKVLFGSINEVGNQTVATTSDLLDFTRQFGGVASSMGITAEQVVALGGAFRDFQVSADVAGTAAVRFFSRATQQADKFGEVLGITAEEFRARFSADALGTVTQVFEQLGKKAKDNKLAVTDFFRSIKAETREQNAFTKLIENADQLGKKLTIGQDILKNYNSVETEAAKRGETFSAAIVKLSNAFQAMVERLSPLIKVLGKLISMFADVLKAIADAGWTGFVVILASVAAGLTALVLTVVKIAAQFRLARTAILDATKALQEFNAISRGTAAPSLAGAAAGAAGAAPKGGGTSGKVAKGAAAVGAVALTAALASSVIDSYGDAGKKSGEAFSDGVKEGVASAPPSEAIKAEATTSATDVIGIVGTAALAISSLIPLMKTVGPMTFKFIGSLGSVATGIAAIASRAVMFSGTISTAFATAIGGATAATAVFVGAAAAAATIGFSLGLGLRAAVRELNGTAAYVREVHKEIDALEGRAKGFKVFQDETNKRTAKLTVNIDSNVVAMTKLNDVSKALVTEWADIAETAGEATKQFNSAKDAFEAFQKATKLDTAKDIKGQVDKMLGSSQRTAQVNEGDARKRFRGVVSAGDKLAGTNIAGTILDSAFDVGGVEAAAKKVKDVLQAKFDEVQEVLVQKSAMANEASRRAGVTKDPQDEATAKALQANAAASQAKMNTLRQTIDAVNGKAKDELIAAIENSKDLSKSGVKIDAAMQEKIDKLQKEANDKFQHGLTKLEGAISDMTEKSLTPVDRAVEEFGQKRKEFLDNLNKVLEDAAASGKSAQAVKELGDSLKAAFDDATRAAFDKKWSDEAKRAIKDRFREAKEALEEYYDDLAQVRREKEVQLAGQKLDVAKQVNAIEAEIERLDKYRDAVNQGANALKTFGDISRSALGGIAGQAEDTRISIKSVTETLVTAAIDYREAYVKAGGDVKKTFDAVKQAAEAAGKSIKQQGFDAGRQIGEQNFANREQTKNANKTLRQSSDARNLVEQVTRIRQSGLDPTQQGAAVGEAVGRAKQQFDKKGIDATDFLNKLEGELKDLFTDPNKSPEASAAEAVKTVGAETNANLKAIQEILKGGNETSKNSQGDALKKIDQSGVSSNDPSKLNFRDAEKNWTRSGRATSKAIEDKQRQKKGITDPLEEAQKSLDVQAASEDYQKRASSLALEKALRNSGVDKKKGEITQSDVDAVNKQLSVLLNGGEFTGLRDKLMKEGKSVDKVDVESLKAAREKLNTKLPSTKDAQESGGDISKKIDDAASGQKTFNEKMGSLTASLEKYFSENNWSGLNDRLAAVEAKVTAAGSASGKS